jgi:type VI protein secretion system component VasA
MEVVTRRTSMLRLGLRMLSINSESFGVMKLKKLIANLSKDENFVMALVDMLSIFVLQVAKKDGNIYPPTM